MCTRLRREKNGWERKRKLISFVFNRDDWKVGERILRSVICENWSEAGESNEG